MTTHQRRSDVPLASAERLADRAPRNPDELERAFAAAYHRRGIVTIDLGQALEDWFRQSVVNWATARWGSR